MKLYQLIIVVGAFGGLVLALVGGVVVALVVSR